jgi:hypothetical protein
MMTVYFIGKGPISHLGEVWTDAQFSSCGNQPRHVCDHHYPLLQRKGDEILDPAKGLSATVWSGLKLDCVRHLPKLTAVRSDCTMPKVSARLLIEP